MSAQRRVALLVGAVALAAVAVVAAAVRLFRRELRRATARRRTTPKPRAGRPPLSFALGFRTDPEARDLRRAGAVRARRARCRGGALREARFARGEGRRRASQVGPKGRSTGSSSSRSCTPTPRSCSSTSGSRGSGRTRATRRGLAVGARRGARHALRRRRRQPAAPEPPARAARVHPLLLGARRVTKLPPPRQLEALRVAAEHGGLREQLLYGVGLQRVGRPVSAARVFDRAARRYPDDVEAQVAGAVGQFDKDAPERAFGRLGPLSRTYPEASRRFGSISASCFCGRAGSTRRSASSGSPRGAARLAARARGPSLSRDDPHGPLLSTALTTAALVTTL